MDNFYEQLVTTYKTGWYKGFTAMIYVYWIIAVLFLPFNFLFTLVLALVGLGLFLYKKNLYVEYEYDFTNGEIDIDRIVDRKKRKREITFNAKDVELLAPEDSEHIKDFPGKPAEIRTFLPKTSTAVVYTAMITGGTTRLQLKFVPDAEFLSLFFKYNPRALKRN